MAKSKFTLVSLSCLIILLTNCSPHKSFVATSFEPLIVEKKKDMEFTASIRPFKFYKFNYTYSLSNWFAIRVGYSGFPSLNNYDASALSYKNFKFIGIYGGFNYNYQDNHINRSIPLAFFFESRKYYKYNCKYSSPGIVAGFKYFDNRYSLHAICKVSYNIVETYNYSWFEDNGSGKSSGFFVKDNETLSYDLSDFWSVDFSYVYLTPLSKITNFKIQGGFNYCQTVLINKYSFDRRDYSNHYVNKQNYHPVTKRVYLSIGLVFKIIGGK